jgi:hypothetical protein
MIDDDDDDDDDCGAICGVRIDRGNRSTRRKPDLVPLCPPQIPHDLTQAAAVGSRRLTCLSYGLAKIILKLISQDSSICITTGYRLDRRGSTSGRDKRYFSSPQRPDRSEREAGHSPPSSAEGKNVGAIPPLPHAFL